MVNFLGKKRVINNSDEQDPCINETKIVLEISFEYLKSSSISSCHDCRARLYLKESYFLVCGHKYHKACLTDRITDNEVTQGYHKCKVCRLEDHSVVKHLKGDETSRVYRFFEEVHEFRLLEESLIESEMCLIYAAFLWGIYIFYLVFCRLVPYGIQQIIPLICALLSSASL